MIGNSFLQKVFLTIFLGACAAGLLQAYVHIVWKANEDINGKGALEEIYKNARNAREAKHHPQ